MLVTLMSPCSDWPPKSRFTIPTETAARTTSQSYSRQKHRTSGNVRMTEVNLTALMPCLRQLSWLQSCAHFLMLQLQLLLPSCRHRWWPSLRSHMWQVTAWVTQNPRHGYGFFGGTEFPTRTHTPEKPVAKPVTFPSNKAFKMILRQFQ